MSAITLLGLATTVDSYKDSIVLEANHDIQRHQCVRTIDETDA